MAKTIHSDVQDNGLNTIKTASTRAILCEGAPVSFANATTNKPTGVKLGDVAVVTGDFTLMAGATNARKVRFLGKAGLSIDVAGTPDHLAFVDDGGSRLLCVTPFTPTPSGSAPIATVFSLNLQDLAEIGAPT